jgi:hypothetical protein
MKQLLFIICMLACSAAAFCQDSYVTLDGQTIPGKIENYKEWSKNPSTVLFKDNNGTEITLTPENSKSFSAGNDQYVSYHGTRIINSENALKNVGLISSVTTTDTVNVFLHQIYKFENYKLYKLFDSKRTNFYFSDNDYIHELAFYETLEKNYAVAFTGYKNMLNKEFSDKNISNFQESIDRLVYKENDLINFLANALNDQSHSSQKLRNKYPTEFLIGVGANANVGTLESIFGKYTFHQTSFGPSLELGMRVYSQRNFGKFFFQPYINAFPLLSNFTDAPAKVKAMVVAVNLGVGYLLVKKPNFSFYAEAAGSLAIFFNLQTRNINGNYVKAEGLDDRITVHPELGVILNQHWNIAVNDMLATRLPFYSNQEYAYKLSQISVVTRYAFIQGHSTK